LLSPQDPNDKNYFTIDAYTGLDAEFERQVNAITKCVNPWSDWLKK